MYTEEDIINDQTILSLLTEYCCVRSDHNITDWKQPGPVHSAGGQVWSHHAEGQGHLPSHHLGRHAGHPVPHARYLCLTKFSLIKVKQFSRTADLGNTGEGVGSRSLLLQDF